MILSQRMIRWRSLLSVRILRSRRLRRLSRRKQRALMSETVNWDNINKIFFLQFYFVRDKVRTMFGEWWGERIRFINKAQWCGERTTRQDKVRWIPFGEYRSLTRFIDQVIVQGEMTMFCLYCSSTMCQDNVKWWGEMTTRQDNVQPLVMSILITDEVHRQCVKTMFGIPLKFSSL